MTKYQVDCARERIRNYIDDNPALNQTRFAFLIGRSRTTVTRFLNEKPGAMGPRTLTRCARLMGMTLKELGSPLTEEDFKPVEVDA